MRLQMSARFERVVILLAIAGVVLCVFLWEVLK